MKSVFALSTSRMKSILFLFFSAPWISLAQKSTPYLVSTDTPLELVGFPIHSPPLDAGTVTFVQGTLVGWSPSFTDRPFGSALLEGQEYYAEVVGPVGHTWLGHRFELDEAATRSRTDHGLVASSSSLNTRGLPSAGLVGAALEIRSHLSLPALAGDTIERRVIHGGESTQSFQFFLSSPNGGFFWAIPFVSGKGGAYWVDQNSLKTVPASQLLIPPGSSVGMKFGMVRGLAVALSGETRKNPVAKPLAQGFNFAAYPYPDNLRLGQDWGSQSSGFQANRSPRGADRIEICSGFRRMAYSPELGTAGNPIRWRLVDPVRRHEWKLPAEYLEEIPVGQGFLIWKNRPDPDHFFYPPKP